MLIRRTNATDSQAIHQLLLNSFDASENQEVALLSQALQQQPQALSLVAEDNSGLLGHVLFTPLWLTSPQPYSGYILAPLAVRPDKQRQGIGTKLISSGIETLKHQATSYVMVLGDPAYYQRHGFHANHQLQPPYPRPYPEAWLAQELQPGVLSSLTGTVRCCAPLMHATYW